VPDFHIHVIFATDRLIATRPGAIRGFLAGWFETIAFMRANKAKTAETAMAVLDLNRGIAERTYDTLMPMFSDDGRFNAKALAALSRSYVDLKFLPAQPDMSKLYTEAFLPKK
jgi:NitT/TauT family transport system substrate-binding protein